MTLSGEGLGSGHFQGCQVSGRPNLFYKIWADFFSFIFRRPVFLSFWMENHWKTLKINKKGWTRDIWLNIQLSIRLGSSNSTLIHQFYYSALTWLRSPTFSIRLYSKSRVGTPLRRYLQNTQQSGIWIPDYLAFYLFLTIYQRGWVHKPSISLLLSLQLVRNFWEPTVRRNVVTVAHVVASFAILFWIGRLNFRTMIWIFRMPIQLWRTSALSLDPRFRYCLWTPFFHISIQI